MPFNQWFRSTGSRRIALPFAASFFCALVVFGLPTLFSSSVSAARQDQPQNQPAVQSQQPPPSAATPQQPTPPPPTPLVTRLRGVLGILVILGIGFALSHNRKSIR